MTKTSAMFGGVALAAGVVAIYFWQQLRHQREVSAPAQLVGQPAPQLPPPGPTPIVVQALASPAEARAALAPSATPPAPFPIAYTPEFDRIFKNQRPDRDYSLIAKMHSTMEQESRDPEWAPVMEEEWRTMFAGKQDLMRHAISTIECRSTMCEIRIVGRGLSEEELAKAVQQPGAAPSAKFSQLDTVLTTADSQNDTAVHVTVVRHTRVPAKTAP